MYEAGDVVTVTANTAPDGQQFAVWTGDTGYLEDAEMSEGRIVKIVPCQNKKDTTEKIIELLREKGIIR